MSDVTDQMTDDTDRTESTNRVEVKSVGKARLLTLADLDRRTSAYRETAKLIDELEEDLGGRDRLSTAERQLIQRAAVLGAMLEDQEVSWIGGKSLDVATYCTGINAQRRVLETIGLRRRARDITPSLSAYLRTDRDEDDDQ